VLAKLPCYNHRKICKLVDCKHLAVETPVTLTCLSVVCFDLKINHMQNKFLQTESTVEELKEK
jgi:hypothetical protein